MRIVLLSLLVCLVLCGCPRQPKETQLVREFFSLSSDEQERQFRHYTLEQQYELYIFGMEVVHPPAMYLARAFAERGPAVVPFLLEKLKRTQDDSVVFDIFIVFAELKMLKHFDPARHPEVLIALEDRAASIKGPWKEPVLKVLSEIKSNPD